MTLVIDYSLARPTTQAIRAAGYAGVVRYLGGSHTKDITTPELEQLLAAGLSVALVWEAGAAAALAGRTRGLMDGIDANAAATAVGFPPDRPIYYAVDTQITTAQLPTVIAYLDGAASAGGRPVGVYGQATVIDTAHLHGVAWLWQTMAWSSGRISAHAQLVQTTRSSPIPDVDVNIVAPGVTDWGQATTTGAPDMTPAEMDTLADLVTDRLLAKVLQPGPVAETGPHGVQIPDGTDVAHLLARLLKAAIDTPSPAVIAAAVIAALPAGQGGTLTTGDVEAAVRTVLNGTTLHAP